MVSETREHGPQPSTGSRARRGLARLCTRKRDGEGKVTPLELFSAGVVELDADVRGLIRAAA